MVEILACGFLVVDIVVADIDRIANPGETIFVHRGIEISIGGHPANVAIDLVKLGIRPDIIGVSGAVGNDMFGDFIERTLRSYGLNVFLQRVNMSTNKNVILVVRGEDRRFHVEIGASRMYAPSLVKKLIERERPRIFYLASGILDQVDNKIEEIFRTAKEHGAITFADVVKPYGKGWDYIIPAMEYIDIFHCNDKEAVNIAHTESLEEAIDFIIERGVKLLLITMGGRGAIGASKCVRIMQKAFKVRVIDPTGAGDGFCAGIIYKLMEMKIRNLDKLIAMKEELVRMILYAQAVGAMACTAPGTTSGVTKRRVEELIGDQGKELLMSTTIREWN
ncbi:MAG: hypothetical protein DRJ66_03170 [Thermoprotei archaeon]|nr:MAG: hypothetical protein DRJ66_03170 [Thermoprotei archaeon]RLF19551.1 MAG: hypothetical protein DRZ82_05300 [Thermoprotei archaeon]